MKPSKEQAHTTDYMDYLCTDYKISLSNNFCGCFIMMNNFYHKQQIAGVNYIYNSDFKLHKHLTPKNLYKRKFPDFTIMYTSYIVDKQNNNIKTKLISYAYTFISHTHFIIRIIASLLYWTQL